MKVQLLPCWLIYWLKLELLTGVGLQAEYLNLHCRHFVPFSRAPILNKHLASYGNFFFFLDRKWLVFHQISRANVALSLPGRLLPARNLGKVLVDFIRIPRSIQRRLRQKARQKAMMIQSSTNRHRRVPRLCPF